MKRFVGCLSLALGVLVAASRCNGANEVTGPERGGQAASAPSTPTPNATPLPRPTPDPCRQPKNPCELVRR